MNGCFYLDRRIFDHWIWQNPIQGFRWVDLIGIAVWKDHTIFVKSNRIDLKRGQIAISVRGLARRWKTNNRVASSFIKLLETAGMVTCDRSNRSWMVISICNYEKYQNPYARGQDFDYSQSEPVGVLIDPVENLSEENGQKGHQKRHPNKEDNNIINNNSSSSSTREENLKFFENLKNNKNEIEDLANLLECETEKIRTMMKKFIIEVVDEEHGSAGKFRTHFINWARKHLEIQNSKNNGNGEQKSKSSAGGTSEDRFANRRGTDAKDHAEEDYIGTF